MSNNRGIVNLYENYCKTTVKGLEVSKEQFKRILKRFSILVIDKVLDAEEVKIPIIGTLRVKKVKQNFAINKLKIDWAETKKIGKKVYHLNEDRDGYFYRYSWRRNAITNIKYYSFVPEKWHVRRRLPKFLKANPGKDFFTN